MRLDTPTRAFVGLVAVAIAPYAVLALASCTLVSLAAYRLSVHGARSLTRDVELWPGLAVIVLVAAGTVAAAASLRRQLRATRQLDAHVAARRLPLRPALQASVERTGLGGRVELVDSAEPFSFAYGLLAPKVVVSRALVESLPPAQLEAVLQHERYHLRTLDPAKVVVARALSSAFFFLPALGHLRQRYVVGRELAADRQAVRHGGPTPLVGALYQVVRGSSWSELAAAAAVGGPELLDVRITQLETGREPPLPRISRLSFALTALALVILVGGLVFTVVALGGPGAMMQQTMNGRMGDMDDDRPGLGVVGTVASIAVWGAVALGVQRWVSRRRRA